MIPKKKRLTKEFFQILMKEGKTFSSPFFLFYFLKDKSFGFSFVAPKKSFKTAVLRNKYKRLGYNMIRPILPKKGSGIFVYKKTAITQNTKILKDDIYFILNKTNLL